MPVVENEITRTNDALSEYKEGLELLENGQPFVPRPAAKSKDGSRGTKRKKSDDLNQSPRKRKRTADSDDDDDDSIAAVSDDEDSDHKDSDDEDDSDNDSETGSNGDNEDVLEEMTVDTVKVKIEEYKRIIGEARERKVQLRKEKKEAADRLATLKKGLARLQRDKNAFCSLRRSEVWTIVDNSWNRRFLTGASSFREMYSRKTSEWA